uniref:F-box domain-containing protein n=1 Tax=Steinernema glaseri TaxID=37863 RepID=A0A1I7Y7K8_9BILA
MNSVPYLFLADAVSRLKSLENLKDLSGRWSVAACKEADSRILCTFRLSARGIYQFDCAPGGILNFEEVKKLNLKHLRISHIEIGCWSGYDRVGFHEFDTTSWQRLLSFANRYFTCGHHLSVRNYDHFAYRKREMDILETIYGFNNAKELFVQFLKEANPEFLPHLLKNAHPEVLTLGMFCAPHSVREVLEAWPESGIREVRIAESCINTDVYLLKHIYQLWKDGFFAARRFHAKFTCYKFCDLVTPLLGRPTVDGSDKEWHLRHPLRKTFQISQSDGKHGMRKIVISL